MSWCVVDDDLLTLKLTKLWLSKIEEISEVDLFDNAQILIDAIVRKDVSPEYIILDLHMPIMSGWEFLEKVEELKLSGFKVIICSSSAELKDKNLQNQYHFVNGFIEKPINKEKILELI